MIIIIRLFSEEIGLSTGEIITKYFVSFLLFFRNILET